MNPYRFPAIILLLLLCACTAHDAQTRHESTSGSEEKILNVYSWAEYIAPDTVAQFEKETGIKIHYDTYDNNEILETKLLTGHSNYDVVVPSENFFDRQLRAGVYRPLDKSEVPNLTNADPRITRRMAIHDPGNRYAVPYMWYTTGLGYNVDLVRKRLGAQITDSWALLFDPRNAERLKDCGIGVIESPLDVIGSALIYLGRDPNRHSADDVAAAAATLRKVRPYIRTFEVDPIAPLANGDLCLVLAWSGDVGAARNRASAASTGAHIAYLVPREGAFITVDMMAIPADAPHPHNAEMWLNYLLRPTVTAAITNYIRYPNGNAASLPFVEESVKDDPNIYPDAATFSRLVTNSPVALDYTRLVTRAWTRFRTGQ
jgi:putrescine transport system substrate-binding protein